MSFDTALKKSSDVLWVDPHFVDVDEPTGLWFCDSPADAIAVKINAVALRSESSWDDLLKCTEFFAAFPYLFVVSGDPAKRAAMVTEIKQRVVSVPIIVSTDAAFRGCPSISGFVAKYQMSRVNELLISAEEVPAHGILNIADIKQPDMTTIPRALSGIRELDLLIGGFFRGQLSLWTGERGEGKSTILGQMLIEAVNGGDVVCAYSGELPAWQFKRWLLLQAAGPENIIMRRDKLTGRMVATVPETTQKLIDAWWDRKLFVYDIGISNAQDEDSILEKFEYTHRRYGASVFLVDNIMTTNFRHTRDSDYYRAQSNFAGRLVSFAKQHNAHVHLVAHPRKADGKRKHLQNDDVGGSGDLPNRADNVFALERAAADNNGELEYQTILRVLKNRTYGEKKDIGLCFESKSTRFYKSKSGNPNKKYGWDTSGSQVGFKDLGDEPVPFDTADSKGA